MNTTVNKLIKALEPYFVRSSGNNVIGGNLSPDTSGVRDLGTREKPFRRVYALELVGSSAILDDQISYVHIASARTITAQHTFAPLSTAAPFVLGANAQGQVVVGLRADQLNKTVTAGNGLTGGGALSGNITVTLGTPTSLSATSTNSSSAGTHTHAIDSTIARSAISITAGNGLTGGGNLTADRSIVLGTPSSLTATSTNTVTSTSHTHVIDSTIARSAITVSAGVGLSGGGDLTASRTISMGTPSALTATSTNSVSGTTHTHSIDSTIARSAITITAGNGLTGGGDLTADRTVTLGTPGSLNAATTDSVTTTSHTHSILANVAASGLSVSSSAAVGSSSALARADHIHAISSSSSPGANVSLLASDATGKLTLPLMVATTSLTTHLVTAGAGQSLTLQAPLDLILDPTSDLVRMGSGASLQASSYASQTTGWRITDAGEADFRYMFVDEMHAKSFIADLEQALAGGQIIAKSVAVVATAFTLPTAGNNGTLRVRDLPSAPNMAVFQSGDFVGLRLFSRAAGSLTIGWAWGTVTGYADGTGGNEGTQTWTFTRHATTPGAATGVIPADALVLDFGVSGNGFYEVNAIDGAYGVNSPYAQVVTWATHPATQTVRARMGNLRGIFSVADEFGLYAGSGTAVTDRYIRASNSALELRNVPLALYDGSANTLLLSAGTNNNSPFLAMGSPLPDGALTNDGIWAGLSEATTNLFTNPSFETNTTGLAAYNTGTPTGTRARSTDFAKFGAYSYKIDKTGGAAQSDRYGVYNSVNVVSGQTYTFSVWVKVSAISGGLERVWIQASTNVTTALAYIYGVSDWQRVVITTTATGTGSARFYVAVDNCDTATIYVDGFQCENRATATEYCDGSLGADYAWTGTAHASTSTRNGGYKLRVGEVSGGTLVKGLYWNGTDLIWKATNTSLDASGNLTATNATLTGTITADLGAIGGWTIASTGLTATNIGLYSGAANTARLQVGTGSNVAGVNSVSAGTDIAFWAGDTHANRTAAEFRVRADGQLYATGATLSGAITATSGTITGDFSVTGGGRLTAGDGEVVFDASGQAMGLYPNIDGAATPPDTAKAIAWYDTPSTRTGLQARQYVGKASDSTPHWNVTVNPGGSSPLTMTLWYGGATLNALWFTNLAQVVGLPGLFLAKGTPNTAQIPNGARLQLNIGSEFSAAAHLKAAAANTYDIGEAGVKWRKLYVGEVIADTVSGGTALGGNTWQRADAGDMYIYSFSEATNRTLYVANPGAGTMSLDVEGNIALGGSITVGGNVDGVDLSAFKTAYDSHNHDGRYYTETELQTSGSATVHWGNISSKPSTFAPSAHALVGADHTASGLTTGHVVRASGTTTFAWAQLAHSDLSGVGANDHHSQSHVLASTSGLGADHTVAGLTARQVLRATGATTAAFGAIEDADLPSTIVRTSRQVIAGNGLTGGGALSADVTVTMGTPSTLSVSSTNAVTSTSHTHAITSSSNPGASASLLSTTAGGLLTLANLATTGAWYKAGTVYQYYEVAEFSTSGNPTTGTIKITLPKLNSSTMMVLRIVGFQYTSGTAYGRGGWEALIGGYNSSGWASPGHQVILHGEVPFSQVRLCDDGSNNIILLGDTGSQWYYPKISVAYAMMGHLNLTGWETGWSITAITDETGITTRRTPAIYHAPPDSRILTAGNGLTGGGDLSADRTFTLGTPSALSATSTDAVTTTSHTHSIDSTIARSAITIAAGDGLTGGGNLTANRTVTLGTPSSLTATTTNAVTTTSHTHAITTGAAVGLSVSSTSAEGSGASIARADHTHAIATSSNPGVAASILASDASGNLNLQGLFIRGTRAIPSVLQLRSTTNDSSWVTGDLLGAVEFYSQDASSPGQGVKAAIRAVHVGTATALPQTGLVFTTNADTEAMRIDHLGNVGVGLNAPTSKLHVRGTPGSNTYLKIDTTTTASADKFIELVSGGNIASGSYWIYATDSLVDGSDFVVRGDGAVAIGSLDPGSYKLHVSGTGKFTGSVDTDVQFLGQASDTVSAPSFSWTTDTNTGLWRPAADTLSITTGGTEVARFAVRDIAFFNSTLKPWSTTYRGLQLGAYASIMVSPTFNAGYTSHLIYNAYYDSGNAWKYQNNNPAVSYIQGAAGHTWRVAPTGSADAALTWTAAMTLSLDGRLSIGNTNNTYALDVTGDARLTGDLYVDGGLVDFGSDYFEEDGTYLQLKGAKPFTLNQTIRAASWNITTAGAATFTDVIAPSVRAGAATELVIGAGADIQLNPTGVVKLASGKLVRSSTFTSGFAGSGWQIDDGVITAGRISAEFDDLTIRGRLRVYELLIQQIRATNGSVFVTSTGKAKTVSGGPSSFTITTDTPNNHGFLVGDLIRAQRFTGSGVYQSDLQVTAVADLYTFTATKIAGDDPASGMDFVRLGSTSDASRRGSVYLTADDSGAPFIDIVDGINSHSAWNSRTADAGVKARIGRITGITGNANEYGIWAGTGTGNTAQSLVASSAGITLNNAPINFKAGSSTVVMQLSPGAGNASPFLAMGSALPTAPLTGNGLWMGKDGSDYEFRVGTVSGGALSQGMHWDGSKLNIKGSLVLGPGTGYTVKDAWLYLPLDAPPSAPWQLNTTGHLGQPALVTGNVIGEPGRFGCAARLRGSGTNYISNPSFEADTSYWTIYNGATYSRITTDAVYGSACASITTGATNNPYLYRANFQDGPTLATGQTYTFSLYVKAGNAGAIGKNVTLYLRENGDGGYQTTATLAVSASWQRVSVTRTLTHATPTSLNHYVVFTSTAGSGDIFLLDAIQLEQTAYASPYIDSTMPNVVLSSTNHFQAAEGRLSYVARQTVPLTGSLSMWIKPVNTGGTYVTFFRYSGAAGHVILRAQPSNSSWQGFWGTTARTSAASTVQWDTWQHVVVTGDGTNTNVYVNGVLVASGTSGTALSYHASAYATIGYSASAEAGCGWVDDVFTTPNVLSADDVRAIYESGQPVYCPTSNFEFQLSDGTLANINANSTGIYAINANGDESFALANGAKVWGSRYSGGNSLASGDLVLGDPDQFHFMYDASAASLLIGKATEEHIAIDAASLALKYNTTTFASMTASDFTIGTVENIRITPTIVEFRNSSTVIGSLDGTTLTLGQTSGNHVVITATSLDIKYGSTPKISMNSSGDASFTGSINATGGTVGGWTLGESSLTGGSATLSSTGKLTLGTGNNVLIADAGDANYRLYIGHATPASAPFSVTKTGGLTSSLGVIGGWTITSDRFQGGADARLYSTGKMALGSIYGMVVIDPNHADWRIWSGVAADIESNPLSSQFRVSKQGQLTASGATIYGHIVANSGDIAGVLTVGAGGRISSGATAWGTGDGFWFEHNSGNPRVRIGTAAGNRLLFETTTGILTIVGNGSGITAISGSNITTGTLDASVVTVTNLSASNITTGTLNADRIATGSLHASKIESNTITGTQITGTTLSGIFADMGTLTAGSIVIGSANKIWLNDSADGALALGGNVKGSAPFQVSNTGVLTATGATVTGTIQATAGYIGNTDGWNIGAGEITSVSSGATAMRLSALGASPFLALGATAAPGLWMGDGLWMGQEEATTNLVTNPSFETNTTSWSNYSNGAATGTRTRVTTHALAGTYSYELVKTGGADADRWGISRTLSVVSGQNYTFSAWVKVTAIAGGTQAILMQASTNVVLAQAQITGVGDWRRLTVTTTATSTGTAYFYIWIHSATTATIYVDAVQIENKAYATPYIDGSMATGTWAGTAHASASSRTAATRARMGLLSSNALTAGWAWDGAALNVVGSITATGGSITGAMSIGSTLTMGTGGVIKSGATAYNSGTGYWLEHNGGTPRMFLGNSAGNKLLWTGSALELTGSITATSGDISGVLTIGASGGIYQGTGTFASPTTGLKIWNDSSAGYIGRIGGYNAGALQWYAGTDGKLYAGNGVAIMDANGFTVEASSSYAATRGYRLATVAGVNLGGVYSQNNTLSKETFISLFANTLDGSTPINTDAASKSTASVVSVARSTSNTLLKATGNTAAAAKTSSIDLVGGSAGARIDLDTGTLNLTNVAGEISVNVTGFMDVSNALRSLSLRVDGDAPGGGIAGTISFTNVTVAAASGVYGNVEMNGATGRANTGWMKIYVGADVRYIPYWTQIG